MAPKRKTQTIARTPSEERTIPSDFEGSERPDPMREVEALREELQQLRNQLQQRAHNPPAQESIRLNIGRKPEPFRVTKAECRFTRGFERLNGGGLRLLAIKLADARHYGLLYLL